MELCPAGPIPEVLLGERGCSTSLPCSIARTEAWAEVSMLVKTVGTCGCTVTGMDLLLHNCQDARASSESTLRFREETRDETALGLSHLAPQYCPSTCLLAFLTVWARSWDSLTSSEMGTQSRDRHSSGRKPPAM